MTLTGMEANMTNPITYFIQRWRMERRLRRLAR